MANIADFKSQMIGGGARPNLFQVEFTFPEFANFTIGRKASILCKAASLPGSTLANIQVFYRGRQVNFAGERTFDTWSVQIFNDTDFAVRDAFEQWSNLIQNRSSINGVSSPSAYQKDMAVSQLDRNGNKIKTYTFKDAYPIEVTPIELSYDSGAEIEVFNVTFQYNYWESSATSPVAEITQAFQAASGLFS